MHALQAQSAVLECFRIFQLKKQVMHGLLTHKQQQSLMADNHRMARTLRSAFQAWRANTQVHFAVIASAWLIGLKSLYKHAVIAWSIMQAFSHCDASHISHHLSQCINAQDTHAGLIGASATSANVTLALTAISPTAL